MNCETIFENTFEKIKQCETEDYTCFTYKNGYGAGISCTKK